MSEKNSAKISIEKTPESEFLIGCLKLIQSKGADYNAGGVRRDDYWLYGERSIMHCIWQKTLRLRSLIDSGYLPVHESMQDTLMDLINYCLFLAMYSKKEF